MVDGQPWKYFSFFLYSLKHKQTKNREKKTRFFNSIFLFRCICSATNNNFFFAILKKGKYLIFRHKNHFDASEQSKKRQLCGCVLMEEEEEEALSGKRTHTHRFSAIQSPALIARVTLEAVAYKELSVFF